MSKKLNEFKNLLTDKIKSKIPTQTEWVKVSSVNWEERTMVGIGEQNGLEYHDIVLGLGSVDVKPKIGSSALIGSINNSAACYMIAAEEIEAFEVVDQTGFKWSLNDGQMTINGENFGGIVNAVELKTQLDKNTLILEKIQSVFSSWNAVPNDGGAALKALVSQFTTLSRSDLSSIQNTKIKHGNG
jgi:hypothetical protein